MRNFKLFILALVSLFAFGACSDSGSDVPDVDYTQEIIGVWSYYDEVSDFSDKFEFKTDGTFWNYGNEGDEIWDYEGQWKLNANELVLTTAEGELLRAIVDVFEEDVLVMDNLTTGTKRVYHYLNTEDFTFPSNLVGTWTCLEEGYAEALTITEEGITYSTGVANGTYWEDRVGVMLFVVDGNYMGINEETEDFYGGRYEIVSGKLLAITNLDTGVCHTYQFCEQDLSEEIVGMWVCNDGHPDIENDMAIITYSEDGKMTMTAPNSVFIPNDFVNQACDYKVVGDLVFKIFPKENIAEGGNSYLVSRVAYTPKGTSLGDILIEHQYTPSENGTMELTFSFLRIKQTLDLANKSYNYSANYISNAKGSDFTILDYTFDASKVDGSRLDQMLKSLLFSVEFPNANTIKYKYRYNNESVTFEVPIVVNGNKVTIKMSAKDSAYRDIEVYMFQDQDNTQLHMYMHTKSFINLFGNLQLNALKSESKIDLTDTAAVEKVFADLSECIESINFTLVFKTR